MTNPIDSGYAGLVERLQKAEYQLTRMKEARAQQPDWEKLWEEQSNRADALAKQVENLVQIAKDRSQDLRLDTKDRLAAMALHSRMLAALADSPAQTEEGNGDVL